MTGILAYATYLPTGRLDLAEVGRTLGSSGRGQRVVAAFDEDSTTLAVEAAREAVRTVPTTDVWFATTSPAYLDKTNAAAVHAALALPATGFAYDLAGSLRSGLAALRGAAATGGLAALADVRVGLPGSADERGGADAAAAFVFGDGASVVAEVLGWASQTTEVLDRWRSPAEAQSQVWEERFGLEVYGPLITGTAKQLLDGAGITAADHVRVVSPNSAVVKKAASLVRGTVSSGGSPVGHCGAADTGLALADVLDIAESGQTILVLSAADGCDGMLLRTTDKLPDHRQATPLRAQLSQGRAVAYASYLTWRGLLPREAPRRPEPDRPAAPPSARAQSWKFGFTGSRCTACGFIQLPPARMCRQCRTADRLDEVRLADSAGSVATYTVDRLAYSPAPPLIDAVIDFAGGGRCSLEVADTDPAQLAVGAPVQLVFRRLFTSGGVHNYFWKARVVAERSEDES